MPQDSPSAFPPSSTTAPTGTGHRLSASAAEGGGSTSKRSSLPPGFRPFNHLQYNTNPSPLQRTLTPPPPEQLGPHDAEPFPSVESLESAGSGQNFHISASGLPTSASSNDNTSPLMRGHHYHHSQSSSFGSKADTLESELHGPLFTTCKGRDTDRPVIVMCASCSRPWKLSTAFACTECICGVCSDCVGLIIASPVYTQPGVAPMRRGCPRCGVMGGKWKRFNLDFR
jgi:hypothetical protein